MFSSVFSLGSSASPSEEKNKDNSPCQDECKVQEDGKNGIEKKIMIAKHPFVTQEEYDMKFALGDIPAEYFDKMSKNLDDLIGKWQVVLSKSDSLDPIMRELGYNALKRKVMALYPSVTDVEIVYKNYNDENNNSENNNNDENNENNESIKNGTYPVVTIASHLPLGSVKKGVVPYNGQYTILEDAEFGEWRTIGCFIEGRSLQRREGRGGVMFDARCTFKQLAPGGLEPTPGKEAEETPTQLFRWTYIPHETKIPIISNRWFKKLKN